jgi:hypothetical protein
MDFGWIRSFSSLIATGRTIFPRLIPLRPRLRGRLVVAVLFTCFRSFASLVRAGKAVFFELVLAFVLVVHFLPWSDPPVLL